MKENPIVWFEIYVQDMARAQRFYENVFACKLQKLEGTEHEMMAFPMSMQASGAAGALVRMPGFDGGGTGVIVYFSCDDCAVEASRVNAAGGRLEHDKFSIGEYGFIALAVDSEGNMIGLHSRQ
ncbi:MAG: VOC family protein [Burkholderiaceae bacterium]|nr:VOC family protein [Burkholderiaceae bacterium]